MPRITLPTLPQTLSYAVLGAIAIGALLAILLAVRGDWLGMILALLLAGFVYWFICRQRVTVVAARGAALASTIVAFVAALLDLVAGRPVPGLLFMLGAIVLGLAFVLLQQGGVPAELRFGGIAALGAPSRAALLRMLEELRDAGVLTEDEFLAKRALLAL
jgi:hypothetical protein